MTDGRQYIKRVYRVPKDRGAATYFATLCEKALVKHGWPAKWRFCQLPGEPEAFEIYHAFAPDNPPDDFMRAVEIGVRITARSYRVEVDAHRGFVNLAHPYQVVAGGHFKRIKS